jgi:multicomponent Na+:H+ antiporter subunit F
MIIAAIIALLLFSLVCLVRVIIGPALLDRVAGADAIGIMLTVILVLLGQLFQRSIFLDIAMVYALLLFVDFLIIVKFIDHQGGL